MLFRFAYVPYVCSTIKKKTLLLSLFLQKLKGDCGVIFFFRVSPESRVQSRVLSSPVQLLGHGTI